MEIEKTPLFTRRVPELMDDDEYALLQAALVVNPRLGRVITGTGGIRKVRWSGSGRESAVARASSTLRRSSTTPF
jgi:hypothetical protein